MNQQFNTYFKVKAFFHFVDSSMWCARFGTGYFLEFIFSTFEVNFSYLYWKLCLQIHLELFSWLFYFHCWYYFGYFHHHNNMACPRQRADFCFVQFHHYLICTFYFVIDFPNLANVLKNNKIESFLGQMKNTLFHSLPN